VAEPAPSPRVAAARQRTAARAAVSGSRLRPVTGLVLGIVVVATCTAQPRPALDGRGLGVLLALVAYALGIAVILRPGRPRHAAPTLLALGAAAVALVALQRHGVGAVAASVPVFAAFQWLAPREARWFGAAVTLGVVLGGTLAAGDGWDVASDVLLLSLMAVVATQIRAARDGQAETELLYAEVQDARDAQALAAADRERGRIAGELHDVLAHSLSGAALQLQGARRLLARDPAVTPPALEAVDRAAQLVREGLAEARQAVGALRGEALPTSARLPGLVARLKDDLRLDVELAVEGEPRPLSAEAELALYRGAQEALTNVARHAPGARVRVALVHGPDATTLTVTDSGATGAARDPSPLAGASGGYGLEAMRERAARAGGHCASGPLDGDAGWRVRLDVPA
jgi:signal transduction histidine kinase